jgi:hypothetical protein
MISAEDSLLFERFGGSADGAYSWQRAEFTMQCFAYANNYVHTSLASPALAMVLLADTGLGVDLVSLAISHGTSTSTNLDWTVGGLTFAAIGSSTTLRFISNSPTPLGGILLDGVSVTGVPAAVPQPSSVLLLALGMGALAASRWRRG